MIELRDVSKRFSTFSGDFAALDNISLKFDACGMVFIMGPSGSGKTTLLNIIGLLDDTSSGRLTIDGRDVSSLSAKRREVLRNNHFAFMFQHYFLLEGWSASANVELALRLSGDNHREARVNAQALFAKFGLESIMDQDALTLSGGEKQRVALMRAIAKRSPIILADEPTGALDSSNGMLVMETLKSLAKTKLIIIVTHDHALAKRYGDRMIELDHGKVKHDITLVPTCIGIKGRSFTRDRSLPSAIGRRLAFLGAGRLALSFLSLTFGVITTLLTIGVKYGSAEAAATHPLKAADSRLYYVSRKEATEIADTPLKLVSYKRPEISELMSTLSAIPHAAIDVSLRGLLSPQGSLWRHQKPLEGFRFEPLVFADDTFNNASFSNVYANEAAVALLEQGVPSLEENGIILDIALPTSFPATDGTMISDTFTLKLPLDIVEVIEDVRLQATPIIFYDFFSAKRLLREMEVAELSKRLDSKIDWLTRLEMADPLDAVGNYERMVLLASKEEALTLQAKIREEATLAWSGSYVYERQLLESIVASIGFGLTFFTLISAISTLLLVIMSLTHVKSFHRRRLALVWQLGLPLGEVKGIIITIGRLLGGFASLTGLLLTPLVVFVINRIIESRVSIARMVRVPWQSFQGLPFALPLTIIIAVLFIAEATTRIVTYSLGRQALFEELKDDD